MQRNGNKEKKKGKIDVLGIIVLIVAITQIATDRNIEDNSAIFALILFLIPVILLVAALKRGKAGIVKEKGEMLRARMTEAVAGGVMLREKKADPAEIENDRYIKQLSGFLKNGIVSRQEYAYMLQQYQKNHLNKR